MRRLLPVLLSMSALVAATPHVPADEADPQVLGTVTHLAQIEVVRGGCEAEGRAERVGGLHVAAHGTAGAAPFLEAGAVEDVLAEDSEETGGFVHALEADGAGGEFDEGGGGGREGLEGEGCGVGVG